MRYPSLRQPPSGFTGRKKRSEWWEKISSIINHPLWKYNDHDHIMTMDLLEFYTSHGTRAPTDANKMRDFERPLGAWGIQSYPMIAQDVEKTLTHFVVHAVGHNRATNCWIMLDPCFWSIGHKLMVFFGARPSWKRMRQGHFLQTIFSWVSMFIRKHRTCKNAETAWHIVEVAILQCCGWSTGQKST